MSLPFLFHLLLFLLPSFLAILTLGRFFYLEKKRNNPNTVNILRNDTSRKSWESSGDWPLREVESRSLMEQGWGQGEVSWIFWEGDRPRPHPSCCCCYYCFLSWPWSLSLFSFFLPPLFLAPGADGALLPPPSSFAPPVPSAAPRLSFSTHWRGPSRYRFTLKKQRQTQITIHVLLKFIEYFDVLCMSWELYLTIY